MPPVKNRNKCRRGVPTTVLTPPVTGDDTLVSLAKAWLDAGMCHASEVAGSQSASFVEGLRWRRLTRLCNFTVAPPTLRCPCMACMLTRLWLASLPSASPGVGAGMLTHGRVHRLQQRMAAS
jgi:hypothetical protein